jgi:hypothetical protein
VFRDFVTDPSFSRHSLLSLIFYENYSPDRIGQPATIHPFTQAKFHQKESIRMKKFFYVAGQFF